MTQQRNPPAGSGSGSPSRRRGGRNGTDADGARPYDFRRPTKLSREHVRALQLGYETYARQCTTLLTSTLRVAGQMTLISVEQLTYDEYVGTLGTPTFMALLGLEPVSGVGVFEMSMETSMATVDHLLGGPGGPGQPTRVLTDLEEPLLRRFVERMLQEFTYAFASLLSFRPTVTAIEYNPQFAQVAAASDTIIAASFELRVGAVECMATLVLPFQPVFPLLEAATGRAPLSDQQRRRREAAARAVAERLNGVPLPVAVELGRTSLIAEEILNLSVGDVLPLGHGITEPLRVTAAGVTFAHAVPGTHGKRLACLVVPNADLHPDSNSHSDGAPT